jgi:signal transduction histidine kinase
MTRRRWGLAALGIMLMGWIIGGEWVSIHQHVPENHFIDAIGGLSFLVAGLVALDRRPRNRMGWLMIAYVAVSYLGNWGNLQVAVVPMIGTAGQQLGAPILAQMVLSYPTGRLRTRFERFVIGTIYAVAIGVSAVIALAYDPRADGCTRCAWEPAPFPNRHAVLTAISAGQRAGFFVFLLLIIALWLRWRRATPAERLGLAPLWVAASIYMVVGLMGTFASPDPTAQPFAYLVWELQSVLQIILPIVFLWGLLSTRLARSAVGDLVMELERPLLPGELRASLARALGDPSLDLLYALEGQGRWVNADGQPRFLPAPGGGRQARTATVVEREGEPLAALIHDPALDQGLVRAAAAAAGMAIVNERLQAEVRAQLEEVRASRQRIVEAGDAERRRVERNLHDGAQQRMATLALSLAMLRDRVAGNPAMAASLDQAAAELKLAIGELRELARGIHPAILPEEGLPAAVEALADRSSLPVRVRADFDERLPEPVEATAYFVVSESLANVAKYARASGAQVALWRRNGSLHVEVIDDGVGGADASRGSGLRGLEDRVSAVRGSFRVRTSPGGGTCVVAEIPCDA